jgi:flagellar hook-basal body complex protein FliE
MPAPISAPSSISLPASIEPSATPRGGGAFQDAFTSAIQSVEGIGRDASASVQRFLSGEGGEELHNTIMASQRAELAFEMFLQVRNKVVSAYQEVMRMQM